MRLLATSLFLSMIALAASAAVPTARSATFAPTRVDGSGGSTTAVAGWQTQSSDKAQESGADISTAGYSTEGWYPVSGRATVKAGLL
jgi:exo-1,4-beta-D-glucosaminidase